MCFVLGTKPIPAKDSPVGQGVIAYASGVSAKNKRAETRCQLGLDRCDKRHFLAKICKHQWVGLSKVSYQYRLRAVVALIEALLNTLTACNAENTNALITQARKGEVCERNSRKTTPLNIISSENPTNKVIASMLAQVRRHVKVGTLKVVREERYGKRAVKIYRSSHDVYFIPMMVAPRLKDLMLQVYRHWEPHLSASITQAFQELDEGDGFRLYRDSSGQVQLQLERFSGLNGKKPYVVRLHLAPFCSKLDVSRSPATSLHSRRYVECKYYILIFA